MRRFLVLMLWVTSGILILGLATAGSTMARATQSAGAGTHRARIHVINLRKAYAARLGYTAQQQLPPPGIFYAKGLTPIAGRGGNNCTEPYCAVDDNGGSVQHNPHVYLLLWGPDWSTDPSQAATASHLENFYSGLGVQPQDNWSTVTSQYGDSTGNPTFGGSVFEGAYYDPSTPPTGVDQTGLATEADTFAAQQGITDLTDAQIVVATQSGTCPQGFYAPSCGGKGYYCAWHSASNEPYINLPYLLDAGVACGEDSVNANGTYDGLTIAASHEYADTITDPFPTSGWWDPEDLSGGEAGDKCAWTSGNQDVNLSTGSFAMQALWSNSAGGCVMPIGGSSDIVTVRGPGTQSTYQGSNLSLQIEGTSTRKKYPLTWTATGLPDGLTIDTSSGVVSGAIQAAPGSYNVSVTAFDTTESSGFTTFTWNVKADVGTIITNKAAGICLNDHQASIAAGNQVVMWACKNGPAEKWTHPTNSGELIVLGQCLTDPRHGAAGQLQVIEPCTRASNQEWYHNAQTEYVLEKNLLCLTDLDGSTVNGEPVRVEPCTNAQDQRWSGK
jgi:Ricin-type beta-trefoil lectin domain/Putative Ig domain